MTRKKFLTVASLAAVLVALATAIEVERLGSGTSSVLGRGGAFVFINLAILGILVLIFFVIRALSRLYLERKRQTLGHSFKTKLVTIFVILVSIPGTILFVVTSQIVTGTIERWFTIQTQVPLESSVDIGAYLYDIRREQALSLAQRMASLPPGSPTPRLPEGFVSRTISARNFSDGPEIYENAFRGREGTEILSEKSREVIRAVSPVFQNGTVSRIVVVEVELPASLVHNMRMVQTAYEDYKSLESIKAPIKTGYFLTLALVTLFIIFSVLLAALHVAKGITKPIQALSEGTRSVAEGNFDVRLEVTGRDELGLLTEAFNRMVYELRTGQERLRSAYTEMDRKHFILTNIINNIASGVLCVDPAGNVVLINNAACAILGIPALAVRNLTSRDILEQVESEELRGILHDIRHKDFMGRSWELKARIREVPVILRLFVASLKDARGEVSGVLVVFDDMTEIVKAQRAYAWQEVARRMTHEIKNPLTPIKLSAERLLKKYREASPDLEAVLESSINTITREVESLRRMVNEFSRFGRMPDLKLEAVDLVQVLQEVVSLYSNFRDMTITTAIGDNVPRAHADREQIRRVLINLMDNAAEAVERMGHIWVAIEYEASSERIRLTLADDGGGILPDDRELLFLPHFSTKKSGTGLGLAIVNKIVSDHQGTIRVEDNTPRGARFILELPKVQQV